MVKERVRYIEKTKEQERAIRVKKTIAAKRAILREKTKEQERANYD